MKDPPQTRETWVGGILPDCDYGHRSMSKKGDIVYKAFFSPALRRKISGIKPYWTTTVGFKGSYETISGLMASLTVNGSAGPSI